MAWEWIIGIFITVVAATVAIVVTINFAKRKKPVWACRTSHIIGRDAEAPPELKLLFGTREVTDVYKTTLIFFNKGNETIRGDLQDATDINEHVAIHFKGAEILRQPVIEKTSKEAIRFSAKQVVKGGDNAIELYFRYLGHNDGAVIEVWHTECDTIDDSGDIMNVEIRKLKEFITSRPENFRSSLIISLGLMAFLGWIWREIAFDIVQTGVDLGMVGGATVLTIIFGFLTIQNMYRLFRYKVFPSWSVLKE